MKQSALEAFPKQFTEPLEGRVHSLYLDILGLVTTGAGNLVDPVEQAIHLPWIHCTLCAAGHTEPHEHSGPVASMSSIAQAWSELKARKDLAKMHWKYAAKLNDLRLTDQAIDALVISRVLSNEKLMRKALHGWDNYPADAQLGCMSMAWAVGAGFTTKFGNFTRAANADDWMGAKASCEIRTAGNPGVIPRNTQNRLCFDNAAKVLAFGLDREQIYWPLPVVEDVIEPEPDTVPDATSGMHALATKMAAEYDAVGQAAKNQRGWDKDEE